jgi:hypothetical protein
VQHAAHTSVHSEWNRDAARKQSYWTVERRRGLANNEPDGVELVLQRLNGRLGRGHRCETLSKDRSCTSRGGKTHALVREAL